MQPQRTGKPCGTKHDTIFIPFHFRFQVEGYAARVVGERMWHASQEIVPLKPDGSVIEFRARLSGLEEITRWVLSWSSKAQVLGPPALRKRVRDELRAMVGAAGKV